MINIKFLIDLIDGCVSSGTDYDVSKERSAAILKGRYEF